MSQLQRTINHCDICGHEWIAKPGVTYTHCTSGKCRSRKWDRKDIPATGEEGKALAAKAVEILLEKRPHLKPKRETTTGYVAPINPAGKPCKACGALGGNHFRGCKEDW